MREKKNESCPRSKCFASLTPEDKKASRASWNGWDIFHTVFILAIIISVMIYFSPYRCSKIESPFTSLGKAYYMDWKELLKHEIESTYQSTDGLINLVDENRLEWKPSAENNWMTLGQLLMHLTDACGAPVRGFVTGDWGLPEGVDISELTPKEMLPPAEKMPTIKSVIDARKRLEKDKQVALEILAQCNDYDLANKKIRAPWDEREVILGYRFLQMVSHLNYHKSQLFYYLKLQGKPVDTSHLWGI
jgi:hypothetical protein